MATTTTLAEVSLSTPRAVLSKATEAPRAFQSLNIPTWRSYSSVGRSMTLLLLSEHHRPLVNPSSSVCINTSAPPLLTLSITVTDLAAQLHHGIDESYTLTIPITGGAANLWAQTA
ncbi:hypothetical protein TB2_007624 [Malus domestica]